MGLTEFLTPEFWFHIAGKGVRILVIITAAVIVQRILGAVVERFFFVGGGITALHFEEKRARTLTELLKTLIRYVLYFIALVLVLSEFQVDTTSLIAGAGVVGLALGVGAQSLIKDFITGFFIILEDQYAMGDYIVSGDQAGTVEEIGFRVTKLRDGKGVLHIIPNGSIVKVSNHTRGPMQAVVDIPVAQEADIDQVLKLLEQACSEVKAMLEVVEGPKVLGIVELRAAEVVVRLTAKTIPLEQSKVETALRYKIKRLFAEAHIPIPATASVRL